MKAEVILNCGGETKRFTVQGDSLEQMYDKAYAEARSYIEKESPEETKKPSLSAGLEEEIDAVWNPRFNLGWDEHSCLTMNRAGFASIARHFAEWGAEHLKK